MTDFLSKDACEANARVWRRLSRDLEGGHVSQQQRAKTAHLLAERWARAAQAGGTPLNARPRYTTTHFALKQLGAF